jgi:hypothetical protein
MPNLCLDFWTGDGTSTQCFGPYLPWPGFIPKENPVPQSPERCTLGNAFALSSLVVVSESGKVLRALTALPSLNAG